YKLKGFLEEVGLDFKKHSLKKIPVAGEVREQIQLHIKSGNQPYIPGSSLKGAIRTALVSFFFESEGDKLIKKKGYIGEDIFGRYGNDILKYMLVSDTMPFQGDVLRIARFYKLNLESKKSTIPVIKEVIAQGSVSTFTIKTIAKKGEVEDKFSFLYEGNEESLLGIINTYSQKNIEIELEQLQKHRGNQLKDIEEFYINLLDTVIKADHSKEAYLRIGSGKTFYDNTIAQKLSKHLLCQVIRRNYNKVDVNSFPITWTIIIEGFCIEVPGWIRISKE
ncbi:MAG: type III-A CRISPR-associated RAMP protein Csm5, partial [Firmicutes bacterium]|nr:type III-A CRISPR-associated RAMP protein Csm5 [Bacillota bacterium]